MAELHNPFVGRAYNDAPVGRAIDAAEVRRALQILADQDGKCEVRAVRTPRALSAVRYGSDLDGLVSAVQDMVAWKAIYLCLNPVSLDAPSAQKASDCHVTRRLWQFIEIDSIRASGGKDACATDAEKAAALVQKDETLGQLTAAGWPAPVQIDSGNGYYLLYRIDLPNDEESKQLLRQLLHRISENATVKIDRVVYNASRIARIPGTWNKKGKDTPSRPHRMCKLLHVPETLTVVTREQIVAVAGEPATPPTPGNNGKEEKNPFKGRATDSRLEAYCRSLLNGEVLAVALAIPGGSGGHGRNNTLNEAAFAIGTMIHWGILDEAHVIDVLTVAAARAGLEDSEIMPTIQSGLEAGKALPRQLPAWVNKESPRAGGEPAVPVPGAKDAAVFGQPIPSSLLKAADPNVAWVWNGFLLRGEVTLVTALWKAGKTTLLAHLLKAMEAGGTFLGREVQMAKVLYVTEESEARWAERRDCHGLADNIEFQIRPFALKPRNERWEAFLSHVQNLVEDKCYDVVIFDTLANLWPVRDENDASSVQAALMPLHSIIDRVALMLVHHNRKGDGAEATASRGSGALTGFVDTIIEFRRYAPSDRKDRRRVLTGYGRHDETPQELVINLTSDLGYVALGDKEEIVCKELDAAILATGLLPKSPPGRTVDQIHEDWPEGVKPKPGLKRLRDALDAGVGLPGKWLKTGEGKRGSPGCYWQPSPTEGEAA